MLGTSRLECKSDGDWGLVGNTGPIIYPKCLTIYCSFKQDSNTFVINSTETHFSIGTEVTVSCKEGFTPLNDTYSVLTCNTNGWYPIPFNCTRNVVTVQTFVSSSLVAIGGVIVSLLIVSVLILIIISVFYLVYMRKKRITASG